MGHHVPKLNDPSLLIEKCFINGHWTNASSNITFSVHDPATGELVGHALECSTPDVNAAIDAAASALPSFRSLTGRQRAKILRNWYNLMMANAEDIATLITWESGKPLTDAKGEALYAANFLEWFSEEAPRIYGDTIPSTNGTMRAMTTRQPIGVCALITPWNFPAAMGTRKMGPALAAGCTVVVKSPGETPFTMNAVVELARRAGVPAGVINVVTALKNTAEVGSILTSSPVVKKVSFTGSTEVGKLLMRQSASTLKKLSLELGGNAPFIVFDDCKDLDDAVAGCLAAKFRSSGQTCVCANRIYVQSGVYQKFANKLTRKVETQLKLGHGFSEGTTHGPLIHSRAVDKAEQHVKNAIANGAILRTGGSRATELGGGFFKPTVLTGMNHSMDMATQETFGPVAGLFEFNDEKEVVESANKSTVGLAAYIFSSDMDRVWRVADGLEVGMVGVNTGLISDTATPFGGIKESGFGREGSKYGVDDYTVMKTITIAQSKL